MTNEQLFEQIYTDVDTGRYLEMTSFPARIDSEDKLEIQIYKWAFELIVQAYVESSGTGYKDRLKAENILRFSYLAGALKTIKAKDDYLKTSRSTKKLQKLLNEVFFIEDAPCFKERKQQ